MTQLARNRLSVVFFFLMTGFFLRVLFSAPSQSVAPDLYSQLTFRFIGPQGNRIIAVIGEPGNPNVCYAGAASGGIFKSIDGGISWDPIFDDQTVSSIGSLAMAPSDPNILWVGTGETFIRSNISQGMGIYKSTDAGKTWTCMGLEKTGRIGRVVIDPRDPDRVLASAMGHCYGPQQERGVYRTIDGGRTWERVLFVDENTGCSDLVIDPNNPSILFAGMWTMSIKSWGRWSGGPGGGIYTSRDGGSTWRRLVGNGLPPSPVGKIGLAMSRSDSSRIYALIETNDGVLWRSDDGGENWMLASQDRALTERPHYYSRCAVAPDNSNEIYFAATRMSVSLNGGESSRVLQSSGVGMDNHDIWIDPLNPDRIMVGNDNPGVSISTNRGKTWARLRLPTAQMYHVHVDNQVPYNVYGNRQDGPSTRGPSNSLIGTSIPSALWNQVGGNENGFAIPDPVDHNIVWASGYSGKVDHFDLETHQARSVDPYVDGPLGKAAADAKYRFQWTFPLAISPHDHNVIYAGSQHVHMTTDGGNTWKVISPDLSTNDKSKQKREGGITSDDATPTYYCCLFAIAESPVQKGLIWAGTNDGLLHVTRDAGVTWTNVSSNITGLLPWGTVSNIEPSRYDAGTCYFTMDYHQVDNRNPYVFKTTDFGKSWTLISKGVPKGDLSYAHCVREDPVRKGLLYLGTENALYFTIDDGATWLLLQNNLPHTPVYWLVVQDHFNDLVVATYGRGFWIADDITPLQQLTPGILDSSVHFFIPRPAYRFRTIAVPMINENDQCVGQNPPYGASLSYYLKSVPKGNIRISILGDQGQIIRTLQGTNKVGINRIWWDLRYESAQEARLLTSPIGLPWIGLGQQGWRRFPQDRVSGPLVAPGTYLARLSVGGQEFTQKLEVKKDPNSGGSEEDISAQVKMLLKIRESVNSLVGMINQIEWIRKQLGDLTTVLNKEGDTYAKVSKAGEEFANKLMAFEENLFRMRAQGGNAVQDSLRWPSKFYDQIIRLASDVAQSNSAPPTVPQIGALERYSEILRSYQSELRELIEKDLEAFNMLLKEQNVPGIIVLKTN